MRCVRPRIKFVLLTGLALLCFSIFESVLDASSQDSSDWNDGSLTPRSVDSSHSNKTIERRRVYHLKETVSYNSSRWRDLSKKELHTVPVFTPSVAAKVFNLDDFLGGRDGSPLPFLKNYASPCWYEQRPPSRLYRSNCLIRRGESFTRLSSKGLHSYMRAFQRLDDYMSQGDRRARTWRVRCLPAFLIIGVDKCGTTDLHAKLTRHPLIRSALRKEVRYWSNYRETCEAPLADYVDTFDQAADESRGVMVDVNATRDDLPYHPIMMLDATPSTYKQVYCPYTNTTPGECGTNGHPVSIAEVVRKLMPDVKVIAMVRHPVDRTHSSYFFSSYHVDKREVTGHDFDMETKRFMEKYEECNRLHPTLECALGMHMNITAQEKTVFLGSLFSVYLRQWKGEFRENMKLVRMEDYATDPDQVIQNLLQFLGLHPMPLQPKVKEEIVNQGHNKGTMGPETKEMLNKFFKPFNTQLAREFGSHFLYN